MPLDRVCGERQIGSTDEIACLGKLEATLIVAGLPICFDNHQHTVVNFHVF